MNNIDQGRPKDGDDASSDLLRYVFGVVGTLGVLAVYPLMSSFVGAVLRAATY